MTARQIAIGALALLGASSSRLLPAQGVGPDSVRLVIAPQYQKGWFHRIVFGSGYRRTWTTPVRIPVLHLEAFAGGLTPLKRGGGMQTHSLRLLGADGRQYVFRSVVKDPVSVLPEELQQTLVADVVDDQMSAAHPVAALVVPTLLEAVGVLHVQPRLVLMPDDARLGEFRREFAGRVGLLEERPRDDDDPGVSFAGAEKVIGTIDLRDELEEDPGVRIDAEAFLDARLMDVFLGDWDRHQDQWRWALLVRDGVRRWVPIPRDRDQAFVRFDGLGLDLARVVAPRWVVFGPEYPPIVGATWNGRDLDREFLTELPRTTWHRRARGLRDALTDSVLAAAVAALPPEWGAVEGATLLEALRSRRDALPEMAERYYRFLARDVDIWATDADELARIETDPSGQTTITLARRDDPERPWWRRTFVPNETEEVRVYLRGGRDTVHATGGDARGITVRVIGGGNDDRYDVAGRRDVRLYDDRGDNRAVGAAIDTRPYAARDRPDDPTSLPHRDWGDQRIALPTFGSAPDAGLLLGWRSAKTTYGFRHRPHASTLDWTAMAALGARTGRFEVDGRHYAENSTRYLRLHALLSGIEILRWYGLGNETVREPGRSDAFYRATEHQARLDLTVGWRASDRVQVRFGPRMAFAVTELDEGANAERFIVRDAPYGTGQFAQVGVGGALRFDSRDVPSNARRGLLMELDLVGFPAALDVERSFGRAHGRVATYLSAEGPLRPVLALQAGGSAAFGAGGRIPFHELAFLGSGTTLRGFGQGRLAGEQAAYGTAEARLQLTHLKLLIPGRQGVFGFWDTGRVWARGEQSTRWHHSVGGGLWFGAITESAVASIALASSREGVRLHTRTGFAF